MNARAFIFKWKFLWIAWVLEHDESLEDRLWISNDPVMILKSPKISFFYITFNRKKAWSKTRNFVYKRYSNDIKIA